jgi:hypothetical protein
MLYFGSCIYAWAVLDDDPPIYFFHVAEMTGMCHHSQFFVC